MLGVEWVSQKLRKGYGARQHLEAFELDLPRLGETRRSRDEMKARNVLYEPSGRVEAAQKSAPALSRQPGARAIRRYPDDR